MKLIKNILARVWAFWALILFMVTLLIFFLPLCCCYFWKEPRRSHISHPIFRLWMNIYLPLAGVVLKIYGKQHFQKGKNYIVVCNHNSLMDVPVLSPYTPGPNKTIAKKEMAKIPVFGLLYKLGSVLVDRKSEKSRSQSFVQMKEVLAMGMHMCIYPEGTRNRTNKPLKHFYDGAFKLAVNTQYAIIPAVLIGTKYILPANKPFYFMPGRVRLYFMPPVYPGNDVMELKKKIFDRIWEFYEANEC